MSKVSPVFTSVGIDVSDRTAQVCVMGVSGILEEFKMPLDEESLKKLIPILDPSRGVVLLETGTRSAWIKRVLTGMGLRVVIADARKLHAISKNPYKTDRNDARILARFGLSDLVTGATPETALLSDTYVRPVEHQSIYEQLKMRDQLVRRRGDLVREVRSLVKGRGRTLRKVEAQAFHLLREELPPEVADLVEPTMGAIEALTGAVRKYDGRLEQLAKLHPAVVRLMTIPGIGAIVALAFFVVIGDPARFASVRDVGPYLGLVVKRDQSGNQDPSLGISKAGNGFLRRLLMQSAHFNLGPFGKACAVREWGLGYLERSPQKGAKKKARVAVSRKLAVQMASIWRNERDWIAFPAKNPDSEHVGSDDDCAATPVLQHDRMEIAASPTDPTQSCARRSTTRTNESEEGRRKGASAETTATKATGAKATGAKPTGTKTSGTKTAQPQSAGTGGQPGDPPPTKVGGRGPRGAAQRLQSAEDRAPPSLGRRASGHRSARPGPTSKIAAEEDRDSTLDALAAS